MTLAATRSSFRPLRTVRSLTLGIVLGAFASAAAAVENWQAYTFWGTPTVPFVTTRFSTVPGA